jgi:hypothetical protein
MFARIGGDEMADTGYLIVTRPLFLDTLTCFIAWKKALGYTVYVKTAEEIEGEYSGQDIRFKIRNCIRDYYKNKNVQYVLMIGDSKDLPYPESSQGPPAPSLSDPYELPAGYYRADCIVNGNPITQTYYSTLFYADLSDVTHITQETHSFSGDYKIYVGLIPVRTPAELDTVLKKTVQSNPVNTLTMVFTENYYDPVYAQKCIQEVKTIAGSSLTVDQFLFGTASPDQDVYNAIFSRPGIIDASGHGYMDPNDPNQKPGFGIGNVWICKEDGDRFQYINPLCIFSTCWGDAYQYGECIVESFIKDAKGPATLISRLPNSGPGVQGGGLTQTEMDFWKSLTKGNPVGKAFYDNCISINLNPLNLFGDPSLVIVKPVRRFGDWIRGKNFHRIVASVWTFVAGALLFNPFGVFCIKCGGPANAAGYVGDPVVSVLGMGLVAIGIYGMYTVVKEERTAGIAKEGRRSLK